MAKVEKTQRKRVEDVFSALFCGAVAGAVAKTTVAPLDRTKILFQSEKSFAWRQSSSFRFVLSIDNAVFVKSKTRTARLCSREAKNS